jgi:hypothetical protein
MHRNQEAVYDEISHFGMEVPLANGIKSEEHSGEFFCFVAFLIGYELIHPRRRLAFNEFLSARLTGKAQPDWSRFALQPELDVEKRTT